MMGQCCTGGERPRHPARRLSGAVASLLPGAPLVLLPKCPLCLAGWLTVATGIGVSAAAAQYLEGLVVILCAAALAFSAVRMLRRRGFRCPPPNYRIQSPLCASTVCNVSDAKKESLAHGLHRQGVWTEPAQ